MGTHPLDLLVGLHHYRPLASLQAVRGRVMGVYNFATGGTRVISRVILGSVATQLGVTPTLLLLVGMIGLVQGRSGSIMTLMESSA